MRVIKFAAMLGIWIVSHCSYGTEPVVVGETIVIPSKVLNQKASLNIRLPVSYDALKRKKYPVFFDVGSDDDFLATTGIIHWLSHNQEFPVPEVILISLTTDTAISLIQRGVKSEDFISFFETDVIPFVDENYRTQPFRVISSGERFGAVPLYGLIHKPHLFQGYFAFSPWLRGKDELVADFSDFLGKSDDISAFLWISSGGEARVGENYDRVISLLGQKGRKGLAWKNAEFLNNTQMSQPLLGLPNALESLFADLVLDQESQTFKAGAKSIKDYYQKLSENKYGYKISSERALSIFGYGLLGEGKTKEAIEVFKINASDYPNSPHVHFALTRAYLAEDNLAAALSSQKSAYELASDQNSSYKDMYKNIYTDIKSNLSGK